jgi:glutaminyl-peptide cyclotransferase
MKSTLSPKLSNHVLTGILLAVIISFTASCSKEKKGGNPAADPLNIGYTVKGAWPHDIESFTEGLEIHGGQLYESTGEHGKSWIGVIDIKTGKPDKKVSLEEKYFGEGITILNNKVYQLTYKTKIGFIYDLKTFKKLGSFEYSNAEGWGLTHDNQHIIMSDGTENLTFLDTVTLKPVKTLEVRDEDGAVSEINELEYVDGFIYTNQWKTNLILKIDAQTGKVVGRIDLTAKADEIKLLNINADVLNGIAWHPSTKSLLVTGKHWPVIYILQLKK